MTKEKLRSFSLGDNVFRGWEGYANSVISVLKEKFNLSTKENEELTTRVDSEADFNSFRSEMFIVRT